MSSSLITMMGKRFRICSCIRITESAKLGYLNCLRHILPEIIVWKTFFVFLLASTITCRNSFFFAFLITVKF